MESARALREELDLDFLWEVAGEEEFGFETPGAGLFRPQADRAGIRRHRAGAASGADLLPEKRQGPLQGRAGGNPGRRQAGPGTQGARSGIARRVGGDAGAR
jgi:hypothetical protein